jgi:hypothetical protein
MNDERTLYRFDVAAAAAYLGLQPRQIYRFAERGEIDHLRTASGICRRVVAGKEHQIRISGRLKFSQAGLDAWLDAHRVKVQPAAKSARPTIGAVEMPGRRVFA